MSDSVTRSLLKAEAAKRGWKIDYFGDDEYFCVITSSNGHSEIFRGSRPTSSSANGFIISRYKHMTMQFAESLGYKTPAFVTVPGAVEAREFLKEQGTIVVKPADGSKSEGVTVGIDSEDKLQPAIGYARRFSGTGKIILQQQLSGKLYRLTVVNGKLVAAAHRRAPEVTGNGKDTVRMLIETLNSDPRRGKSTDTPLKKVNLQHAEEYLGTAAMEQIPPGGKTVRVSALDSVSAGGEAVNVTAMVHEDWKRFTEKFSDKAGLFISGFDVMCDDIAEPLRGDYVPLLEVNSSPGLKLHQYPTGGGAPIELAPIILDELFK